MKEFWYEAMQIRLAHQEGAFEPWTEIVLCLSAALTLAWVISVIWGVAMVARGIWRRLAKVETGVGRAGCRSATTVVAGKVG